MSGCSLFGDNGVEDAPYSVVDSAANVKQMGSQANGVTSKWGHKQMGSQANGVRSCILHTHKQMGSGLAFCILGSSLAFCILMGVGSMTSIRSIATLKTVAEVPFRFYQTRKSSLN
jgi:hypothetical protein